MKKLVLSAAVAVLAVCAAPAFAADMPVKAARAVAAPSPWDLAFGTAFTTNYDLRGVSQSNKKPAVQGYFELQYTATPWLKLYAGLWGSSLWTGEANAEFDITAGARMAWGNFGLDVGFIQYEYPGGTINAFGNFPEVYVKPAYKFNNWLTVGGVFELGLGNFNGKLAPVGATWVGSAGHYYYAGNAVITLPWSPGGVTISINPEIGREWYSSGVTTTLGAVSDTYWDVGLVLNYKVVTLDLRYWGINLDPGTTVANQCGLVSAGTNFCGNRFVATLKFDTAMSALK